MTGAPFGTGSRPSDRAADGVSPVPASIPSAGMSNELRAALERAKNHKMSPQEKFCQRVSFVYGQQDYDSPHQWSKRRVAEFIAEQYGYPPEWVDLVPASGIETEGQDPAEGLGAEHESPTAEGGDAQDPPISRQP